MADKIRGTVYVCPVCGAEVAVIAHKVGEFLPRCCNVAMKEAEERLQFYYCPICHSEIGVLRHGEGTIAARCCNKDMVLEAA